MRKVFFALFLLFFCLSCGKNEELKRSIELLRSKPIVLNTDSMRCLINGNDTIIPVEKGALKYVVYTDAQDCVSCTLKKIHLWNDILEESKKYGKKIAFYFIFAPNRKDEHSLELTLKTYSPDCPIYIDTLHLFERDNPNILSNVVLHTFLMNEENQVLLVGNLLRNEKINKMFHEIMESKME